MKNFYLYIFILSCIILIVSIYKTKHESFLNFGSTFSKGRSFLNFGSTFSKKNTIILLGDSVLKNNSYVKGKSVDELLVKKTNGNTLCYAQNNANINDIYSQIDFIPFEANKNSTYIFLSAGGNDILEQFVENSNSNLENNSHILKTIFSAYKKLVKSIQTKMNLANIVLLDIYYPENIKYQQYHPIIKEWNTMLYSTDFQIIKISNILTKPEDFTFGIEPSEIGGNKLANNIYNFI
jgi:hypothetical protein